MRIFGGCASDVGRVRKVNQDGIFFRCLEQQGQCFAVGAVCDGVGGLENGEVASAMIIGEINCWVQGIEQWIDISSSDPKTISSHLKDQAEIWNESLFTYRMSHNLNTGTTMSVIMIVKDFYYVIHVGDSRIYRLREKLEQITVDECSTRLSNGMIRKYLDNYIGKSRELHFNYAEGRVMEGDLFLFCTDGFYHYMKEKDVYRVRERDIENKAISDYCWARISSIIERGETDNISLGIMYAESKKKSWLC